MSAAVPVLTTDHPRVQCIDLRRTFAGRFRFAWDEAYAGERPDFRRIEAPWLTMIPCRFGRIFPWGGRVLAGYSAAGGANRLALQHLPGVTVVQGGEGNCLEVVVIFDVDLIESVATVLRARRPRRFSEEQRARLIAATAGSRFPSRRTADGHSLREIKPGTTIGGQEGSRCGPPGSARKEA